MPSALYDTIGGGYAAYRRPDARLAARIDAALGSARTVVNVGAGAGSYEPAGRAVLAVEPSAVMVAQRRPGSAPAVRGVAEALPLRTASVHAALAVLTIHHWPSWRRGLAEMRRVARERVVLFTWDPASDGFWLVRDYFPEIMPLDRATFPTLEDIADALGPVRVSAVPVPADCTDGFLGAYWRRPEAYLDAGARGAISAFARMPEVEPRLARLARDVRDGAWAERNRGLIALDELDVGYRLVVAELDGST